MEVERRVRMKGEFIDKFAALITAAFGLVMALAWNGLIRAIFKSVFGDPDTIRAMTVYAIVVTIVGVLLVIWVGKAAAKAKGSQEKKE